jgi:transposase
MVKPTCDPSTLCPPGSIDTERLLRSLMAYLRGEPKVWSVVRAPSIAEEDARRLHRERDRLISERVQHVNRIKGLCALHGIYDYQPVAPAGHGAPGAVIPVYRKNDSCCDAAIP